MTTLYFSGSFQFASVFILGLPFALALMTRDSGPKVFGWLLLAPALGASFYFSAGTILHSFGLRAFAVFWFLVGFSIVVSIVLLRFQKWPPMRVFLVGIGACFLGAACTLVLNSTDLVFAGLDYFPLTNNDTFSYLGFIDQIRMTGWIEPRISYPAGYAPLIDHAVFTRTPGVIFVADFADILRLETHSAFFLSQRMALPMIALGASAIVMITTGNWMATLLCFGSLVCGNVLLHQILQQFNSSTMGTVIGAVVIAIAIWTVRSERSEREQVAGHALTGWCCGTMAMTSPEAHPFYLIAFGLVAIIPVVRDRRMMWTISSAVAFVVSYFAASFPFVTKLWPALIEQFVNAGNGHPGDWIASPGFLMQATGVTLTTNPSLMSYRIIPMITSISVLIIFVVSVAVLGWSSRRDGDRTRVLPSDLLALFLVAVAVSVIQAFLYGRGSGYGLLKLTDYFAFLAAVVISVAAYQLSLTESKATRRVLVGLIAAYCVVAFDGKLGVLGRYGERVAWLPLPSAYRLQASNSDNSVSADLSAEPLNLFLYENRYQAMHILFRASESDRFALPAGLETAAPRLIARVSHAGIPGSPVADVTYSVDLSMPVLKTVPAEGQIHLLLPNPQWLAAEGNVVGQLRRWLSVSGKFVVFGPFAANRRSLEAYLTEGPDLRRSNRIEIYFAGERIQSIAPDELPIRLSIPLAAQFNPEAEGEIRIVGPTAGRRQVSVAELRSVPR